MLGTARLTLEVLEDRTLLSAAPLDVRMTGATTTDAASVSVAYQVLGADAGQPLTFAVYRSSAYGSLAGAQFLGSATLLASDSGDLGPGQHSGVRLWLTNAAGQPITALPPGPLQPYIVVVANPGAANQANNVASFEMHVLGVVVHGLEFTPFFQTPQWELNLALTLQQVDGYQAVIAFNWVLASLLPFPGIAAFEGDLLARQVVAEADQLAGQHPGDVVDVQFIGHSRGAVVVSRALQDLAGTNDPALAGGYLQMTLLDPHPANNIFPFLFAFNPTNELSVALAWLDLVFQALAWDPPVVIPANVQHAEEFYQHTPAVGHFPPLNLEAYLNLWGQAPQTLIDNMKSPLSALNLTDVFDPHFGFVGHSEVTAWYQENVADAQRTFSYFGGAT